MLGIATSGVVCLSGLVIFNPAGDDAGKACPDSHADTHYALSLVVAIATSNPIPPWAVSTPQSKWINPTPKVPTGSDPGLYIYRTSFDLTGFQPSTALLAGRMAVDDAVTVKLNGFAVASAGGFVSLQSFSITQGFIEGVNALEFAVVNAGSAPNPTGLRVEMKLTAVPVKVPAPAGIAFVDDDPNCTTWPAGLVFQLSNTPNPPSSLVVTLNGLTLKPDVDFVLNGVNVNFPFYAPTAIWDQDMKLIVADTVKCSYRR